MHKHFEVGQIVRQMNPAAAGQTYKVEGFVLDMVEVREIDPRFISETEFFSPDLLEVVAEAE